MEILKGVDGSYIILQGKLKKIIKVEYSDNYWRCTGGWVQYELEDGTMIKLG